MGKGFIYILSNPSMPGVFKIGLTTNSVYQRIRELSTTGVPQKFKVERLFEIDQSSLLRVESSAHTMLKRMGHHEGKEFFRCDLNLCVEVVEDVIFEMTGAISPDLVGDAQERHKLAEAKRLELQRLQAKQNRIAKLKKASQINLKH